jgi:predicted Zn-dependent protease
VLKGKWNGNDLIVAVPPAAPQVVPFAVKRDLEPDSAAVARGVKKPAAAKETAKARTKEAPIEPVKEATKEPPKDALKETIADKDKDATKTSDSELVLTGKSFFPDSEPRALLRECFAALKSGSSRNPAELYYMRAQAYIQLSEWNSAIDDLTDAIHCTPNKAQYYLARAYVHHMLGQAVRSHEDIEEARFVDTHLAAKVTFRD